MDFVNFNQGKIPKLKFHIEDVEEKENYIVI